MNLFPFPDGRKSVLVTTRPPSTMMTPVCEHRCMEHNKTVGCHNTGGKASQAVSCYYQLSSSSPSSQAVSCYYQLSSSSSSSQAVSCYYQLSSSSPSSQAVSCYYQLSSSSPSKMVCPHEHYSAKSWIFSFE